jgi:hypothetical protein
VSRLVSGQGLLAIKAQVSARRRPGERPGGRKFQWGAGAGLGTSTTTTTTTTPTSITTTTIIISSSSSITTTNTFFVRAELMQVHGGHMKDDDGSVSQTVATAPFCTGRASHSGHSTNRQIGGQNSEGQNCETWKIKTTFPDNSDASKLEPDDEEDEEIPQSLTADGGQASARRRPGERPTEARRAPDGGQGSARRRPGERPTGAPMLPTRG